MPRPAMLVATVTAPSRPAWLTISLSRSTFSGRALSTAASMPRSRRACTISSLAATLVVPMSTGRPFSCVVSTFLSSAFILPACVRKTASSLSRRAMGSAVGIGSTRSLYVCSSSGASVKAVPVMPESLGKTRKRF